MCVLLCVLLCVLSFIYLEKILRHLLLRSFFPQLWQNLAFSWKCSPQWRQDDPISKREKDKQHNFPPPKHNFSDLLTGGILIFPIHCLVFHLEAFDRFRFVRISIEFCTGKLSICTEKHRIFYLYGEISNFPRRSIRFVRRSIEFSPRRSSIFVRRSFVYLYGATDFPRSSDRFARRTAGSARSRSISTEHQ